MLSTLFRHGTLGVILFTCNMFIFSHALAEDMAISDIKGPSKTRIRFGVVVNNENYTIYRSSKLGKRGLKMLDKHLDELNLPFPKTIVYMNKSGYSFPFYFAVQQYEAKEKYDFDYFHPFSDMRTYVDGHNPFVPTEDIDNKSTLGRKARKYFPLRDDGIDGGIEAVRRVLDIVLDPARQPVLFHCFGGRHRTGMVAMLIRYLQGGFWTEGPTVEAKGMELNPAQYEYLQFNHMMFRSDNVEFADAFSKHPSFLELKSEFSHLLN